MFLNLCDRTSQLFIADRLVTDVNVRCHPRNYSFGQLNVEKKKEKNNPEENERTKKTEIDNL